MTASPAATLRAAAARLRDLVGGVADEMASNSYWSSRIVSASQPNALWARGIRTALGGPSAEFAAAMHPGVAMLLAAVLDQAADAVDGCDVPDDEPVLLLAHQILDTPEDER